MYTLLKLAVLGGGILVILESVHFLIVMNILADILGKLGFKGV